MSELVSLHDKPEIQAYLSKDKALHLYSLGDLDPFFWPKTQWLALKVQGQIQALTLLYLGQVPATLLAFSRDPQPMRELLQGIRSFLPAEFYAHLSLGVEKSLSSHYTLQSHGFYQRMILADLKCPQGKLEKVQPLSEHDLEAIQILYKVAYSDNWFDPRMLATGQYVGIFDQHTLISIAGIHVYSPEYDCAALGNITTHPQYRGQGLASLTTATLCQQLAKQVNVIGLNVAIDNRAAIGCYERLGFVLDHTFEESRAQFTLAPVIDYD